MRIVFATNIYGYYRFQAVCAKEGVCGCMAIAITSICNRLHRERRSSVD